MFTSLFFKEIATGDGLLIANRAHSDHRRSHCYAIEAAAFCLLACLSLPALLVCLTLSSRFGCLALTLSLCLSLFGLSLGRLSACLSSVSLRSLSLSLLALCVTQRRRLQFAIQSIGSVGGHPKRKSRTSAIKVFDKEQSKRLVSGEVTGEVIRIVRI